MLPCEEEPCGLLLVQGERDGEAYKRERERKCSNWSCDANRWTLGRLRRQCCSLPLGFGRGVLDAIPLMFFISPSAIYI